MADKNMGFPIEGAPRINYLKGGGKTVAGPSPLAMRIEQTAYIAANPVIDKDRVEEEVERVRRRLGSEAEELVVRAQSGNAWETVRALEAIRTVIDPVQAPTIQPTQPIEPVVTYERITEGSKTPQTSRLDKAIGTVTGLYQRVASGLVTGLKFADIDRLLTELKQSKTRESALREVPKIAKPIEERVSIRR